MATLHLVTGYKGSAHITAADQGLFNAGCVGLNDYVLASGNRFKAEITGGTTVKIYDGSLVMQGRHVDLEAGATIDVNCGDYASGQNGRYDLIVVEYQVGVMDGTEQAFFSVIHGVESENPQDPVYTTGNIYNGDIRHQMPLYRVWINVMGIIRIEPLFRVVAPLSEIQHGFYKQNLLINGDFQFNQRGEKSYDVGNTVAYSVDMWRAHQVKVVPSLSGVKITGKLSNSIGGYFTQFVDCDEDPNGREYTLSAFVDGKHYTFTTVLTKSAQSFSVGSGTISMLAIETPALDGSGVTEYKIKVNICPATTSTILVKYIDLFKGYIAYPHVKEDPATALMRCKRYIQRGGYVSPVLYRYDASGTSKYKYKIAIAYDTMAHVPSLASCSWSYYDTQSNTVSGDKTDMSIADSSTYMMQLVTPVGNAMNTTCFGIKGSYVVSCEPLYENL